jgi:hypothetical protein
MALYVNGQPCMLCGRPMVEGQKHVLMPPFTANEADSLYRFSDAVMHLECLEREPLAETLRNRLEEFDRFRAPGNRSCTVCARQVTNPDDYLSLGFLTDSSANPLYRYNYAQFHKSCLPNWSELSTVIHSAREELSTGRWRGRGMEWILEQLQHAQVTLLPQ